MLEVYPEDLAVSALLEMQHLSLTQKTGSGFRGLDDVLEVAAAEVVASVRQEVMRESGEMEEARVTPMQISHLVKISSIVIASSRAKAKRRYHPAPRPKRRQWCSCAAPARTSSPSPAALAEAALSSRIKAKVVPVVLMCHSCKNVRFTHPLPPWLRRRYDPVHVGSHGPGTLSPLHYFSLTLSLPPLPPLSPFPLLPRLPSSPFLILTTGGWWCRIEWHVPFLRLLPPLSFIGALAARERAVCGSTRKKQFVLPPFFVSHSFVCEQPGEEPCRVDHMWCCWNEV
ncbi:unnamed protein product [Closterium sp. Naga37s-1]|nr:unnamed protein product [Closterium sp. Naga37s-1]